MICWAISAAKKSGIFRRILVSTEDEEIAAISAGAGAETPFTRPPELAGDHVGLTEVIRHAIDWLARYDSKPEFFACVYATAAFLRPSDLVDAMRRLKTTKGADFVLSVGSYPVSPFQALYKAQGNGLQYRWPEFSEMRTQDLPETFFEAAQFIIGRTQSFLDHPNAMCGHAIAHVLPKLLCHDIDNEEDWQQAEDIFRFLMSPIANQRAS